MYQWQLKQPHVFSLCDKLRRKKIPYTHIGGTKQIKDITIKNFRDVFFCAHVDNLREFWEITSNKLEYKQGEQVKAKQQEELRYYSNPLRFTLNEYLREECYINHSVIF